MGNIRACHCAVARGERRGLGRVHVTSPHCRFLLPGPNPGSLVPSAAPWFSSPLSSFHPSSWVPIPDPQVPPAAGASLDASEPRALSGSSSGQRKARVEETRNTYLPGRLSTSCFSLAGVQLRGPARSLAQLGAGHLASPGHPGSRSAARCHRTWHTEAPSTAPGLCPLQADHTLLPPTALHSCLFDTSPVTPPPGVLPPPQPTCFCARSRLQLPPPVPALLGTSGLRLEGVWISHKPT